VAPTDAVLAAGRMGGGGGGGTRGPGAGGGEMGGRCDSVIYYFSTRTLRCKQPVEVCQADADLTGKSFKFPTALTS
jgi:hypothetical protein